MAQVTDYTVSNQTFPNTRADINNIFAAIATNNSGTTAPSNQQAGQWWIDTTSSTWVLYIHDGTDDIQFATIDTSANTVNFSDSALDVVTDTTPQLGGNLDLNSNDITGTGNINITGNITASGNLAGTLTTASQPNITSLGTLTGLTTTGDINLGDNDNIYLGASNDLQILHNGSNSVIQDVGIGNLFIRGATSIQLQDPSGYRFLTCDELGNGGEVKLYYLDNQKFTTTSSGIDVTGTVVSDGLTVDTDTLYVDSANNRVGIGTTSPDRRLHLHNTGTEVNVRTKFSNATSGEGASDGFEIGINGSNPPDAVLVNYESSPMAFFTNGSERMRIDSSGNLLVGTTSATGSIAKAIAIHHTASTGAGIEVQGSNTSGTFTSVIFRDGDGTDCGSIDINATANTTAYTTSSDYRLKENVVNITGATERLKQLSPKRFNFIADSDTTFDGFLAHEVSDIVPEAIIGTKDEVDADGNPVYQGIDQSKLVPLLVATIKELEARITALET